MSEKTVRELGGEVWAELSRLPDAQLHWKRDEQVVDLVMGVLARHLGASIQNDRDFPAGNALARVASIAEQTEPLVEGEEVWLSDGSLRTRGRVHRAEDGRWAARPTWHFSDGDRSA